MGQRIAIMKDGVLQQCDKPETVYAQPANKFVAGFIGSPPMNFLEATIKEGNRVVAGGLDFPLPAGHPATKLVGKKVTLGANASETALRLVDAVPGLTLADASARAIKLHSGR